MQKTTIGPNISTRSCDYLIVGAGIIGLAIAREIKQRQPQAKVIILEKEPCIGVHSSGRNSGVLHTGIYYQAETLKAKLCAEGAKAMAAYCDEHALPINRVGKVVVPVRQGDDEQLQVLLSRAKQNQARAEIIDAKQLHELEPSSFSITGKALYAPDSAVIDPKAVLKHLSEMLQKTGVEIRLNSKMTHVDQHSKSVNMNNDKISYGYLINSAGMYADIIAKQFGLAEKYIILPFKGIYYRLNPASAIKIQRLIYPVPDMNVPFLGVHFTTLVDGSVYAGPTAVPAFGRENYNGLSGIDMHDAGNVIKHLIKQYRNNNQGFRNFAHAEALRFFKVKFAEAARALVPKITTQDLLASNKVGIRAQLLDVQKEELVMDFVIEKAQDSTHVLNAVSPGFTSAFAMAKYLVNQIKL